MEISLYVIFLLMICYSTIFITTVIHEFGHLFFILLYKNKVYKISVGRGPGFKIKYDCFTISFGIYLGGEVIYEEDENNYAEELMITIGGGLFELISLLIICCYFFSMDTYFFLDNMVLTALCFFQFISLVTNLVPNGKENRQNDGEFCREIINKMRQKHKNP